MGKVLQPPPQPRASAAEQKELAELRAAYPGWWIGVTPGRLVPWDAKRRRGLPWRGGVWAVEATSAEMLRELLDECAVLDAKRAGARS
jgi:hypothetical protein